MAEHDRIAEIHKVFAENNVSGALLWGEHAMSLHGIPTATLRDDIALNDNEIDRAAAALVSKGWQELSLANPPSQPGFWSDGWKEFLCSGRRFLYPKNYPNVFGQELLLLPRSYLGLCSLHSSQTLSDDSSGFNYPSAVSLAGSIAAIFSKSTGHFALLMRAWAAYFIQYDVLKDDELDELERHTELWKELRKLLPA
ncbi:hypothetical protein E4T56_gene3256 [Termitomyces sp. T112]|nr:hypothetical protein E4T56_gene3256 [Termitomyces sp. T112]